MDAGTATNEALTLVTAMVLSLVDNPTQVEIYAEPGPDHTIIHVSTHVSDTGKVVGKLGRTARSMRTILTGHSVRVGHRFMLNIIETDRSPKQWQN